MATIRTGSTVRSRSPPSRPAYRNRTRTESRQAPRERHQQLRVDLDPGGDKGLGGAAHRPHLGTQPGRHHLVELRERPQCRLARPGDRAPDASRRGTAVAIASSSSRSSDTWDANRAAG
ncbi:hypothetical protein [Nonomuraea sp. NPDC049400]|uniref:hypothetical protein n=1 Tax=Nonomuraea sp. NPDC049400 TaxID=3364352 RepID=UPI00379FAB1D